MIIRQNADLVSPHTRWLASSAAKTARLVLWHMQEHMASCVTHRCMQGPEEDGCAKALTEEAAIARQLESAIASDEVRAYCVRLLHRIIGPVPCHGGPPCCLTCDVLGPVTRENRRLCRLRQQSWRPPS